MRYTSSLRLGSGAVAFALLVACRADSPTEPLGLRQAPADPLLTLSGGAGTLIFPVAPPGETQARGAAIGLNDLGQVTGGATGLLPIADDVKAFRWTPGVGVVRITGCCDRQNGVDINDAGVIVGTTQVNVVTGLRGFVASGNTTVTLPILPGADPERNSRAFAINDAGQIVGYSPVSTGANHAVMWTGTGPPLDLGSLGGNISSAIDINGPGQVIGSSLLADDATMHYFLWSSATGMQDLDAVIGPRIIEVVEINDAGQIAGSYIDPVGETHAFLYTPGSGRLDLGTLGGTTSIPTGLNGHGDVVGMSAIADGTMHAFLWTKTDGMEDVTAITGVPEIRRLNDNLQTLTGTARPDAFSFVTTAAVKLVQLQVTQSNTPPLALFTWTCNGLTCTFDASGSLDDKPGLTYAWNLDRAPGGTATGAVTTTTYPHAGPRNVTLTVTDAQGLTSTLTKTVIVLDFPVAAFTVSCTGLTCTFDSSGSTDDVGITRRFWWFGDGATTIDVVAPSHTYAQAGTYDVTLEVRDAAQNPATVTQTVTVAVVPVDAPPVARFTVDCGARPNAKQCTFDASGSTDDVGIVSYVWDWGNGRRETRKSAVAKNTWPKSGSYLVTLTVTDTDGQSSSVAQTVSIP